MGQSCLGYLWIILSPWSRVAAPPSTCLLSPLSCSAARIRPGRPCSSFQRARGLDHRALETGRCSEGQYMGVSKNRGTLKWMVYNGKPYIFWMIWGYINIFLETSICQWCPRFTTNHQESWYHLLIMWPNKSRSSSPNSLLCLNGVYGTSTGIVSRTGKGGKVSVSHFLAQPFSRISTVTVKIEWDLLDSLFIRVLATLRFFCPTWWQVEALLKPKCADCSTFTSFNNHSPILCSTVVPFTAVEMY